MNLHPLDDLFHTSAALSYWQAIAEGKQNDQHHVRTRAYNRYEDLKCQIKTKQ